MSFARLGLKGGGRSLSVAIVSAVALAACSSTGPQVAEKKSRSKEYFAESEYGVKASPRVSHLASNLPRGGGRDQLGRPYKVRGKWYHPKEVPGYRNKGQASWYGDAFHGRLTANGEIYDMTHLTAAHPTMPLPSYARVTNTRNGSSVVVRVNDRGPFHSSRVIDLSRRAAEMLDYTHAGVAQVEVEYMGRAPLHGQDDQFLMASFKPGGGAPDPSDGMPSGTMIAMAGPTPQSPPREQLPFQVVPAAAQPVAPSVSGSDPVLPAFAPIAPQRPDGWGTQLALSYADERVASATGAFAAFENERLSADAIVKSWRGGEGDRAAMPTIEEYVAVGTYATAQAARSAAEAVASFGNASVSSDQDANGYTVTLQGDGRYGIDEMLRGAWAAGASDAMTVRQ